MRYLSPVIALLGLCLSACGNEQNAPQTEAYHHAANLYHVELHEDYLIDRKFAGFATSPQHGQISFELAGKLAAITIDMGDSVKAGAVLAQLDTELLEIEKQELEARFAENRARRKLNQASLKRQQSLEKEGYASQQRLDELLAEQDSIDANTDRLQASLDAVNTRIRKSVLTAPYSGTVTARHANIGTVIAAGTPVLTLLNNSKMEARIGIPERFSHLIQAGKKYPLTIKEKTLSAEVLAMSGDISPVTRTMLVRFALAQPDLITNGSLVELTIQERIPKTGYWIPLSAITEGIRGLWTVYAAVPADKAETASETALYKIESRAVQILYSKDDKAFIKAELGGIDWLVDGGLHRYVPGQIIRPAKSITVDAQSADRIMP